jgi:hypothetical protein
MRAFWRDFQGGPIFDAMDMQFEAIASIVGLKGIFKLKSADIYRVVSVTKNDEERIPLPDNHTAVLLGDLTSDRCVWRPAAATSRAVSEPRSRSARG